MAISDLQYFLLFVSTFVVVGFLTPVMRKIAISKKIYDTPNSAHKTHKEPVPYLGGVAIIIGVILVSYGVAIIDGFDSKNFLLMTSVLAPALVLGAIGFWDDLRNLRPAPRLAIQSAAGLFTAWILISQNTVGTPTESTIIDALITSIWIVGICNSINFFDNLDGGAAGTVAVTSIALFVLAFQGQQFLIAALSAVTAGSTIGFLLWNKSPARIYMGDAGALFLGILIATLTIRLQPNTEVMWTSLATPVLLLAVPILDTCVAVFSRIKRGISPLQGGHDHLSHRLIRGGLSRRTAAFSLWALSAFFALCAIAIPRTSEGLEQIIVAIAALVWAVLFIKFFQSKDA
jgi:UDP-GlcNAc:undecaprenyl-phosphate GlcNAc-1-phosphate transferase